MDFWNVKDLEPPPVNSCKMTAKEIDLRLLDIALKEGIYFFQNQIHLDTEAALISRVVYRSKMKFRNSKDFKSVEKLSRTLRNYQYLDIPRILKTLLDSMPRNYKMNQIYMLTKNMMDYVLVRLQGLGKILCRVLEICKMAATLMGQRIRLGHFWKIAIVMFAATSRVSVIAKNVLKYTCELYTKLLPFSSSLGNAGVRWLPEDYVFPSRLDGWLDVNWLDLENNVIEIPDDDPNLSYLRLADSDDDDVEFCDEYILVNDDTTLDEDTDLEESLEITDLPEHDDSFVDIVENLAEDADVGEVIAPTDIDSDTEEADVGEVIALTDIDSDTEEADVGEVLAPTDIDSHTEVADVGEVIAPTDIDSKTSAKAKRIRKKKKAQSIKNKMAAVREVIAPTDTDSKTSSKARRIRKKKKAQSIKNKMADVGEVIAPTNTDSKSSTKRKRIGKKKKAQSIKNKEADVGEVIALTNTDFKASRKSKRIGKKKKAQSIKNNEVDVGGLQKITKANTSGRKRKRKRSEQVSPNASTSGMSLNWSISLLASTPKQKRKLKRLRSMSNNSKPRIASSNSTKDRKKICARKKKKSS